MTAVQTIAEVSPTLDQAAATSLESEVVQPSTLGLEPTTAPTGSSVVATAAGMRAQRTRNPTIKAVEASYSQAAKNTTARKKPGPKPKAAPKKAAPKKAAPKKKGAKAVKFESPPLEEELTDIDNELLGESDTESEAETAAMVVETKALLAETQDKLTAAEDELKKKGGGKVYSEMPRREIVEEEYDDDTDEEDGEEENGVEKNDAATTNGDVVVNGETADDGEVVMVNGADGQEANGEHETNGNGLNGDETTGPKGRKRSFDEAMDETEQNDALLASHENVLIPKAQADQMIEREKTKAAAQAEAEAAKSSESEAASKSTAEASKKRKNESSDEGDDTNDQPAAKRLCAEVLGTTEAGAEVSDTNSNPEITPTTPNRWAAVNSVSPEKVTDSSANGNTVEAAPITKKKAPTKKAAANSKKSSTSSKGNGKKAGNSGKASDTGAKTTAASSSKGKGKTAATAAGAPAGDPSDSSDDEGKGNNNDKGKKPADDKPSNKRKRTGDDDDNANGKPKKICEKGPMSGQKFGYLYRDLEKGELTKRRGAVDNLYSASTQAFLEAEVSRKRDHVSEVVSRGMNADATSLADLETDLIAHIECTRAQQMLDWSKTSMGEWHDLQRGIAGATEKAKGYAANKKANPNETKALWVRFERKLLRAHEDRYWEGKKEIGEWADGAKELVGARVVEMQADFDAEEGSEEDREKNLDTEMERTRLQVLKIFQDARLGIRMLKAGPKVGVAPEMM